MSSFERGFMLNLLLIVLLISSLQFSNVNGEDEIQFIAQIGEIPIELHSKEINVLKANCAKRSVTLKKCFIESFWVENWTSPDEYFEWSVESPKAADYVVDVLISGAADVPVEIIGPRNRLK